LGPGPCGAGPYAELDSSINAYRASDAPRTDYGWRVKILWIMHPEQTIPVALEGTNVTTGEPLWFALEGEDTSIGASLDPAHPENENLGWKEFPSYVFFPSADCYAVEAAGSGGTWQLGFGIGA
jgi:hypothetical protein